MTILNMATCLGMQLLTVAMFWMHGVSEHWWPTDWCERQEVTASSCFLGFLLPLCCFDSKQEASFHLVTRVMNFVDYKLEKLSLINFDRSLISDTLQTELCVNQRSRYLEALPVCKVTKDLFPEAFAGICTVLKKTVCENGEDWNSEFRRVSAFERLKRWKKCGCAQHCCHCCRAFSCTSTYLVATSVQQ